MRNFNKRFADIRKGIRKGNIEDSLDLLGELQKDIKEKMDRYVTMIESKGKVCISKNKRQIHIKETDCSKHKITFNPVDGRVHLKLAKGYGPVVLTDLMKLCTKLLDADVSPTTLRGKIYYARDIDQYQCTLYSASKKFKTTIEYSPEEEK